MRCSFVSDLHLDATTSERADAFRRFLRWECAHCDELYVLGDLTEAWVGDDDDSAFADLLRTELTLASTRCRLHLMHGNRDFLIGARFARTCGAELIDDPSVIERNGTRLLLCHGDAFCTDDVPYQQTRALLRSRRWQDEVLAKPLTERRALANSMRAQSRASNANKPQNIMDANDAAVVRALQLYQADVVVHGHTHRPGMHEITGSDRSGVRYVLGDWDRCGWLLRFDGELSLMRFALGGRCEI